jgi:hypothetical protein
VQRHARLTRGWIAAAALMAVALGATLPTPTLALGRSDDAAPTRPTLVGLGDPAFDRLVVPPAPRQSVTVDALVPPPPDAAAIPQAPVAAPAIARGPRPAPSPPRNRAPAVGAGTWAVIVGINDYPGNAYDLGAAVNDALEVERAMLMLGAGRDHVMTLLDGAATGDAIRTGLDWLTANAGPDAVAVFFYAGHAVKQGPGVEALVAADGARVGDADMGNRLSALAARRAWIAVAGCYGGGFTELLAPGRILTGAAPANGLAYENSAFNRSYMVEYMVHRAIVEGHARDSVQAAYAYAADAIARDYPGRQPVQVDNSGGPLDLRPSSPPPPPPPPPPAPAPTPTPSPDGGAQPPPTTTPPPQRCWLGFCN